MKFFFVHKVPCITSLITINLFITNSFYIVKYRLGRQYIKTIQEHSIIAHILIKNKLNY
jgi:hypothetical protein